MMYFNEYVNIKIGWVIDSFIGESKILGLIYYVDFWKLVKIFVEVL